MSQAPSRARPTKDVDRIGRKALVYFEVVSTLALVIGLVVVTLYRPGQEINADVSTLDVGSAAAYASSSKSLSTAEFLLSIIPITVVDAFVKGDPPGPAVFGAVQPGAPSFR